jgi:hypothetical protein
LAFTYQLPFSPLDCLAPDKLTENYFHASEIGVELDYRLVINGWAPRKILMPWILRGPKGIVVKVLAKLGTCE